ncbi:STM3941 family protein [Nocardia sp. NPDC058633]|uniref:STM3941 family protein n=1 Tax=Nocardia sp. NPDC058633 TaxID=3346568 RepID=UPI0036615792
MTSGGVAQPATSYYPTLLRSVSMIALSAVFVALGVWIVFSDDAPLLALISGVLCIPLGLGAGLFFVGRLVRRRPELVLTEDGLDHRQSGRFAWDEVSHARIFVQRTSAFSTMRYVQLGLHDPEAYFARSTRRIRLLAKLNQKLGYGTVNLPESMLGASAEQVLTAMCHYRPTLRILP